MTEIFGFLIILGTLIIVILRWQMKKTSAGTKDAAASADQLCAELQKSADEIISRMGGQIDRLETLLVQADAKAVFLEEKISRMEELLQEAGQYAEDAEDTFPHTLRDMMAAEDETAAAEEKEEEHLAPDIKPDISAEAGAEQGRETIQVSAPLSDKAHKVREMLQAGHSIDEIARKLNMGRGAVELMRQMFLK